MLLLVLAQMIRAKLEHKFLNEKRKITLLISVSTDLKSVFVKIGLLELKDHAILFLTSPHLQNLSLSSTNVVKI